MTTKIKKEIDNLYKEREDLYRNTKLQSKEDRATYQRICYNINKYEKIYSEIQAILLEKKNINRKYRDLMFGFGTAIRLKSNRELLKIGRAHV